MLAPPAEGEGSSGEESTIFATCSGCEAAYAAAIAAVGVADQGDPLGPDLLTDRLEVRDVAPQSLALGVGEPGGATRADLVIDVDVEAVSGECA